MTSEPLDVGDWVGQIKSGDRRAALEALRDRLAHEMETCRPGVVAQVAAQLRGTLKEIAELPDVKKVTKVDELAKKRAARRAKAALPAPAARKGNKRGSRSG